MLTRVLCAIWLAGLISAPMPASADAAAECVSPECFTNPEMTAELDALFARMEESHFDLFARVEKSAYLAELERLKASVGGTVTKTGANRLLQQLLAFGRVGHARSSALLNDTLAAVQGGTKIVPLSVVWDERGMVLDNWADTTGRFAPKSEVISIDGVPVSEWQRAFGTIVSADNQRLLRAKVEQAFPLYFAMLMGEVEAVDLIVRWPDGTLASGRLSSVGLGDYLAVRETRPVEGVSIGGFSRKYEVLGNDIGYLKPGAFFNVEGEEGTEPGGYDSAPMQRFIDDAFAEFAGAGVRDLIIDLRGNPGGDNSFSDPMVAKFADRPFAFASKFSIKASAATKERYRENPGKDELGRLMRSLEAAAPNGAIYDVELPLFQPDTKDHFSGKVWVLIDRHSYSNAAVTAALIQDYGFGTILGEETADLPTTYGSVERFTMALTGAEIEYPKSLIIRPSGDAAARGVVPDIVLPPQPIGVPDDVVRVAAIQHILTARGAR